MSDESTNRIEDVAAAVIQFGQFPDRFIGDKFDIPETLLISSAGKPVMLRVKVGTTGALDLLIRKHYSLASMGTWPEMLHWPGHIGALPAIYPRLFPEGRFEVRKLFDVRMRDEGHSKVEEQFGIPDVGLIQSWEGKSLRDFLKAPLVGQPMVYWSVRRPNLNVQLGLVNWCIPVSMTIMNQFAPRPLNYDPQRFAARWGQLPYESFDEDRTITDPNTGKKQTWYERLEEIATDEMDLEVTLKWKEYPQSDAWTWLKDLQGASMVSKENHAEVVFLVGALIVNGKETTKGWHAISPADMEVVWRDFNKYNNEFSYSFTRR